jgi:hypothetical protein
LYSIFVPGITVRKATITDLDLVAPLFDAYRQFYRQPPDLELARQFLSERLQRGESIILLAALPDGSTAGVHVRQASGCPGLGEGTKDQREIERGGLQQDSLGDVATAAHMYSSQTAGLILMRSYRPQA